MAATELMDVMERTVPLVAVVPQVPLVKMELPERMVLLVFVVKLVRIMFERVDLPHHAVF
jgi:hypothetical protein